MGIFAPFGRRVMIVQAMTNALNNGASIKSALMTIHMSVVFLLNLKVNIRKEKRK